MQGCWKAWHLQACTDMLAKVSEHVCAGQDHDVASLGDILGDRMLQAWKLRGEALQKDAR